MEHHNNQKGEITTLFTLVSFVTIIFGLIIGVQNAYQEKKLNSSAQQNCSYSATAVVVKVIKDGQLLTSTENQIMPWGVSNDKQNQQIPAGSFNTKASHTFSTENYTFGQYKDGDRASVSLIGLDTNQYKITDVFCDPLSSEAKGCDYGVSTSTDKLTINNFHITCGVNIRYGWIVELKNIELSPTPSISPSTINTPTPTISQSECTFNPTALVFIESAKKSNEPQPDFSNGKWGIINNKTLQTYGDIPSKWSLFDENGIYAACTQQDILKGCKIEGDTCCGPAGNGYKIKQPGGDKASVTLHYDDLHYKIMEQCFTDLKSGSHVCNSVENSLNPHIFQDLPVTCGASYIYRWKLKSYLLLTPTTEPTETQPSPTPTTAPPTPTPDGGIDCMKNRSCYAVPPEGWNKSCKLTNVIGPPNNTQIFYCCPIGKNGQYKCKNICPTGKIRMQNGECVNPSASLCKKIKGNGEHKILFLTENSSDDDFNSIIEDTIKEMEDTDLGSLLNKLSYYKYDMTDLDMGCYNFDVNDSGGGKGVECDAYDFTDLLNGVCNTDTVVIRSHIEGRSSAGSYVNLSKDANGNTVVHELGHAIANLMDEYPKYEDASESPWGINCTADSSCTEWKNKYGDKTGCFQMCSYANWYRSTENSIMNMGQYFFYDINLEGWKDELENVSTNSNLYNPQNIDIDSKEIYHNVIYLKLNQIKYGLLLQNTLTAKTAYPKKQSLNNTQETYNISVFDSNHIVLYQTYTPAYERLYDGREDKQKQLLNNINLYLPYFENANQIEIRDDSDKIIMTIKLADYNLPKPIDPKDQNLCSNNTCDTAIGEDSISCPSDCAPNATAIEKSTNQYSADVDKNSFVNSLDYAIIIKNYGKRYETGRVPADVIKDGIVNAIDTSTVIDAFGVKIEKE